ncbi:unnamed protein product [Lampetra fluviatilis]
MEGGGEVWTGDTPGVQEIVGAAGPSVSAGAEEGWRHVTAQLELLRTTLTQLCALVTTAARPDRPAGEPSTIAAHATLPAFSATWQDATILGGAGGERLSALTSRPLSHPVPPSLSPWRPPRRAPESPGRELSVRLGGKRPSLICSAGTEQGDGGDGGAGGKVAAMVAAGWPPSDEVPAEKRDEALLYGLEDRPPILVCIILGFQVRGWSASSGRGAALA